MMSRFAPKADHELEASGLDCASRKSGTMLSWIVAGALFLIHAPNFCRMSSRNKDQATSDGRRPARTFPCFARSLTELGRRIKYRMSCWKALIYQMIL